MDKQKILLVASYPMGNEYEEKVAKIEHLRTLGYEINIGHLVNLENYGNGLQLPHEDLAKIQIERNLRNFIDKYHPNVVAFHSGMAFRKFWESTKFYMWDIYIRHTHIKILVEGYDKGELSSLKFEGIDRMEKVIEKQHELYNILWT